MTTRSDLQSVRRRRAVGRARVTAERSEGSPKGLARARRTEARRRCLRECTTKERRGDAPRLGQQEIDQHDRDGHSGVLRSADRRSHLRPSVGQIGAHSRN